MSDGLSLEQQLRLKVTREGAKQATKDELIELIVSLTHQDMMKTNMIKQWIKEGKL